MSIQGPGILFRLRAGGSCPGLTNTRSGAVATLINRTGILQTPTANLLRLHWQDTNGDGVYETPTYAIEPAATNIMLWSRDGSNAAWTKTSCTATKTSTGVDGASNSATLITATAGNGTCLQNVTSGSSARSFTAYVKRITGTGTINMTMDNGSTWTAISPVSTGYTRFRIPVQTLVNPTVGFRIVTNGDAIAVDYCQLQSTNYDTLPLLTTSATVSVNADNCSATFPYRPVAMTFYLRYISTAIVPASDVVLMQVGSGTGALRAYIGINASGQATMSHIPSASSVTANAGSAASAEQSVEIRGVLNSDGSIQVGQSLAGATESVSGTTSPLALAADWAAHTVLLGSIAGSLGCPTRLRNAMILSGVRTMDQCRGLV